VFDVSVICLLHSEGFIGDVALPNVRYELEYELQMRQDAQADKTGKILADWQTDHDQAEDDQVAVSKQPEPSQRNVSQILAKVTSGRSRTSNGSQQHKRRNHPRHPKGKKSSASPTDPK
jgi:hypothetical protein